jgi:hypothetical protein
VLLANGMQLPCSLSLLPHLCFFVVISAIAAVRAAFLTAAAAATAACCNRLWLL